MRARQCAIRARSLINSIAHEVLKCEVCVEFLVCLAAEVVGYRCVGIERHDDYYKMATNVVPKLVGWSRSRSD